MEAVKIEIKEEKNSLEELPGILQAPWESKKHWLCRRKFIEDHREVLGIKVALSLSMVWANINFLGCQYSTKVQEKVMYYPVPEDNEIERWLKVHPNIDSGVKPQGTAFLGKRTSSSRPVSSEEEEQKSAKNEEPSQMIPFEALTHQLDSFITMIRKDNKPPIQDNSNQCNNNDIPSRNDIFQVLAKVCSCNLCFHDTQCHVVSKLMFHIQKAQISSYNFDYDESSQSLDVYINHLFIGNWKGSARKELKITAATEIISEIISFQKYNEPVCLSSRRVIVEKTELEKSNVPISVKNKGHQLLLKMGWKEEDEKINPIIAVGLSGRAGFGSKTSSLSGDNIHQRLSKFISNEDETQLKFPSDLSTQDRKLIHTLSAKFNLSHKSYGKGDERYLIVTKKF